MVCINFNEPFTLHSHWMCRCQHLACVDFNKPWARNSQNTVCSLQLTACHWILDNYNQLKRDSTGGAVLQQIPFLIQWKLFTNNLWFFKVQKGFADVKPERKCQSSEYMALFMLHTGKTICQKTYLWPKNRLCDFRSSKNLNDFMF